MSHPVIIHATGFANQLMDHCDYITGVPDSMLAPIIAQLPYYIAPREDHAVAMAFGARLAGKRPCVFMQNSGVGYIGDVVKGFHGLYATGLILLISCPGEFPYEEPQHQQWGYTSTRSILALMGVACLDANERMDVIAKASNWAFEHERVVAILLRKGSIDEH